MSQQYSLRWNNHQPNFIAMFGQLLQSQLFVDVTLAAEGEHLHAHRLVLSACSTYFQSIFADNPSTHPVVILKDVSFANLRTMIDFMYYGEVNVTEQQLPKVLETAKVLKIKGLTEMPESTSMTRSQGTTADFPPQPDQPEPTRQPASPSNSPSSKKKRRRKSSTGSTSLNMVGDEPRPEDGGQSVDLVRGGGETITLVPQQRRRDFDERGMEAHPQAEHTHIEQMAMDTNMPQVVCTEGGLRLRRSKLFKRQSRVPEEREVRKQVSEPAPPPPAPPGPHLQKHESYPQYPGKNRRSRTQEAEVGSLLIRAVAVVDRQPSTSSDAADAPAQRASHTPAVRAGPPLSCNFCWNTVDEFGRILRRKTQYHCPECRTNLCIVPCFHEYHDGPEFDSASAR